MAFNAKLASTAISNNTIIAWLSVVLMISNFLLVRINGLASDIDCLKSIKESLEDPRSNLESWNFNNKTEGFIGKFAGVESWHNDENKVINLRLSDMGLRGQFPLGVASCSALTGLDLSGNELFGPIPSNISMIIPYATTLDLSNNNLSGEIPAGIANLSFLNVLKLDHNRLTGQIPPQLGLLNRLKTFGVANNLLSGQVPFFDGNTVTSESYQNNPGLCGSPLPLCKVMPPDNNHNFRAFVICGFLVGWSLFTFLGFALTLFYFPTTINPLKMIKIMVSTKKKKKREQEVMVQENESPAAQSQSQCSKNISKLEKMVTRASLEELKNATDNFSPNNIIGVGKRGTMYKAILPNGCVLAVMRFHISESSSDSDSAEERHFVSEIMTLGRLRHTNLVPLMGFCYDTNERVRLLVYKYMPNGNLHDWLLYNQRESEAHITKWPLRVQIAVGLARGLAWLHHNSKFQVIHNNITSKCILLDQDFEPKISNFGEAKLSNPNQTTNLSGQSFNSINGELLEPGFDSKKDVFSFGVVLLELITGKEATCLVDLIINLSSSSFSLYNAVVDQDSLLIGLGFDDEIVELLSIARKCVQSVPDQRPTMLQVYQAMRAIGEKHGLVGDSSEALKQTEEMATASE